MTDLVWMREALREARRAQEKGEVPVGALVVRDGGIIGKGFNRTISAADPTAHAEVCALRDAAYTAGNHRLPGAILYVTVEPCTMCAGALAHARVQRLVYGAREPRAGAVVSTARVLDNPGLNHRVSVTGGLLAGECAELMTGFFQRRRSC